MKTINMPKSDEAPKLANRLIFALCAFCVLGTTLANLAFTIAPMAMIELLRSLMT